MGSADAPSRRSWLPTGNAFAPLGIACHPRRRCSRGRLLHRDIGDVPSQLREPAILRSVGSPRHRQLRCPVGGEQLSARPPTQAPSSRTAPATRPSPRPSGAPRRVRTRAASMLDFRADDRRDGTRIDLLGDEAARLSDKRLHASRSSSVVWRDRSRHRARWRGTRGGAAGCAS